jgi:inorganic pyrophosphatase
MAAALRGAVLRTAPVQQARRLTCAPVSSRVLRPQVLVRSVATKAPEVADYAVEERGPKESLEYRIAFKQNDKVISCWHEIPLWAGEGELHFICEIPKETSAKMEVATDEPSTPIKQDTKKGKLRFYPYNINWNYGLLPQTWEDPAHKNEQLGGVAGDNDPVDVVEIGDAQLKMGGVYRVKPLGVYAMIDDGELDWKVVAINSADPKASKVNTLEDVEREFPGQLQKIMEWFRDYKIPDGKPANAFGFDNKCMDKDFCLQVIDETHQAYVRLKSGKRANSEELSLI